MINGNDDLERLLKRFSGQIFRTTVDGGPRYRLFHAPKSICSQKVRAVLIEAGLPFYSHDLNIFAGENYDPVYVRVRAKACIDAGHELSAHHSGSTSVNGTGCDACVVPTLIDVENDDVIIDSANICRLICDRSAPSLRPHRYINDIDQELATVDALPNYPLMAAKVSKPLPGGLGGNTFAASKVERCDRLLAEHAGDRLLVTAYTAKRDKENSANTALFTHDAIKASEDGMQRAFLQLESRIAHSRAFLFSDELTLADLFWATELIRTDDLGYSEWIAKSPKLSRYYMNLCDAPAIRKAILDWPDARIKLHA